MASNIKTLGYEVSLTNGKSYQLSKDDDMTVTKFRFEFDGHVMHLDFATGEFDFTPQENDKIGLKNITKKQFEIDFDQMFTTDPSTSKCRSASGGWCNCGSGWVCPIKGTIS